MFQKHFPSYTQKCEMIIGQKLDRVKRNMSVIDEFCLLSVSPIRDL